MFETMKHIHTQKYNNFLVFQHLIVSGNVTINRAKVEGNISYINVTLTTVTGLKKKTLAKLTRKLDISSFVTSYVNGRLRFFFI